LNEEAGVEESARRGLAIARRAQVADYHDRMQVFYDLAWSRREKGRGQAGLRRLLSIESTSCRLKSSLSPFSPRERWAATPRGAAPVRLVYSQEFPTRDEASGAQRQLKGWTRKKKEALIRGDWDELRRLARGRQPASAHASTGSG